MVGSRVCFRVTGLRSWTSQFPLDFFFSSRSQVHFLGNLLLLFTGWWFHQTVASLIIKWFWFSSGMILIRFLKVILSTPCVVDFGIAYLSPSACYLEMHMFFFSITSKFLNLYVNINIDYIWVVWNEISSLKYRSLTPCFIKVIPLFLGTLIVFSWLQKSLSPLGIFTKQTNRLKD